MPLTEAGQGRQTGYPRIMMVDDESANLQIVKIIMVREDFESELVLLESGPQALDYLREQRVDLILLDLAMPGMDGFELMNHLKENPATAEIPVIFLSAYQDTEYILRAFELGATDFIAKPIISPILTARIRAVLQTQALKNELQRSNDELVSANRLKDELLSIVSHDLRSPLSAIELLCQFLQDAIAGKPGHSTQELIHRILNQSRLSRRLVENLLDLNRIEEGILTPTASFFDLETLVQECADDEAPIVQSRGIAFSLCRPEHATVCYGDREMIAQVLRNVLGNALKFTRSEVTLSCERRNFSVERGGRVRLTVSDDGEGIPAAQRDAIFEKYAKTEKNAGGSGLGLYISRKMVELHGGWIQVRSGDGLGTEFVIELPNAFDGEQIPELTAFNDSTVAIVSHSRAMAQQLEGLLIEGGLIHVTKLVADTATPEVLHSQAPDVAIVDLESGLDPFRLARDLNASELATRWILYGPAAKMVAFHELTRQPYLSLESPLNPLVLFRHLAGMLDNAQGQGAP